MSINTRLDTLVPNLTARQRAMMVLRALAAGQDPDPALHAIRDDRERRVFNRYIAQLYVVNVELDGMLHSVFYSVESIEGQTTMELLREAAGMVEEQTGEKADPRASSVPSTILAWLTRYPRRLRQRPSAQEQGGGHEHRRQSQRDHACPHRERGSGSSNGSLADRMACSSVSLKRRFSRAKDPLSACSC